MSVKHYQDHMASGSVHIHSRTGSQKKKEHLLHSITSFNAGCGILICSYSTLHDMLTYNTSLDGLGVQMALQRQSTFYTLTSVASFSLPFSFCSLPRCYGQAVTVRRERGTRVQLNLRQTRAPKDWKRRRFSKRSTRKGRGTGQNRERMRWCHTSLSRVSCAGR